MSTILSILFLCDDTDQICILSLFLISSSQASFIHCLCLWVNASLCMLHKVDTQAQCRRQDTKKTYFRSFFYCVVELTNASSLLFHLENESHFCPREKGKQNAVPSCVSWGSPRNRHQDRISRMRGCIRKNAWKE